MFGISKSSHNDRLIHRLYFDLVSKTGVVVDDLGVEALDVTQAIHDACKVIIELRNQVTPMHANFRELIIRDATGTVFARLCL